MEQQRERLSEMQPSSKQEAQDPSNSYERSHPEREAGMGRLDNNKSTPVSDPDRQNDDVKNKQDPSGQINAHEVVNEGAGRDLSKPKG